MKILKWIGIGLTTLVVLIIGFYFKAHWSTEKRLSKKYEFELQPLTVKSDSTIVLEGFRLIKTKGCVDCHSQDLGGKIWIDDPLVGQVIAPNLTKGLGGLPKDFDNNDWLRTLKHRLKRDSTPLRLMPSHEFTQLAEEDIAALITYCSQLNPIDRQLPSTSLAFVGYILADLDKIPLIPAENIDHKKPLAQNIQREVNVEFGKYLTAGCEGCHRKNMKGGPPIAPGFPEVADITSSGHLGQ